MPEESIVSIWVSVYSWFTPTVLFVLLNLMIGIIAITTRKQQQTQDEKQPQLDRAPSLLKRLKSINLYRYSSEELNPFLPSVPTTFQLPPEMETQNTVEQTQEETAVQNPDQFQDHHVTRMNSDTKPASGDLPEKLPQKMKKSASEKSAFAHFEEEITEKRRPATVRERKSEARELQPFGDDEEVDAKADDFINRFKQQLKLQRLDSILRYKEMLSRGAGK
ncbi:hypothetical protein HHK36_021784 [Tetracentron sinense]|uniref:DUF4408 domain-containing protein n=1 Tax=Tetracentron sinense TaxID=13715 RepID=A0A834YUA0_TETSI|nr:hypothetical protein HHK36_021784 [Tetracentron sinense]